MKRCPSNMRTVKVLLMAGAASLLIAAGAIAHDDEKDKPESSAPQANAMTQNGADGTNCGPMGGQMMAMPGMSSLMMPQMNSAHGRKLFASKGCVACHSINGVGGHDATPLDAHTMQPMMNPFEFAAKMWKMAPYMIAAQEEALGEQILFSGEELADIIAFVHDDEEQHRFSEADIPPEIWPMMHHTHGEHGGAADHAEEIGHTHGDEDHADGDDTHGVDAPDDE